ncbi:MULTISPECIES: hypothetical protein [Sorangium]|uniref:Uncharacterized protein n=1 Tax=Sorangium cellulosum TaxID=56 RepID=A0A4P2QSH3_SORCE|nr:MULTISPECIES: hypothetical protein [Sorangium]AUX33175.1 uncharacterized protein SOCE836_053290 [Sorangium cellulosum]AUX33232.1 uncharacterized protein SOCE836_053860 [Sorangium cellulosum]WCQ92551.1 hypothetical protein NQZ70_05292 [Sorangium sp. Soce836]
MIIVLTCAALIWLAARGEELLRLWPAAASVLGPAALLALAGCLAGDETTSRRPGPCRDCHRDCGVLRDECHARCDEMAFCQGDEDQGAGGAGGEP